MESIGFWVKNRSENCDEQHIAPEIEFHINLWKIGKEKQKDSIFIDFGIGLNNIDSIEKIAVYFPFNYDEKNIEDLYDKFKDPNVSRLIFNDNELEIGSIGDYYEIKNRAKLEDNRLLLPLELDKDNDPMAEFKDGAIYISLSKIKSEKKYSSYGRVYFRFRIRSDDLIKKLFMKVNNKNWFLESGFIETQVVDIKVNVERNIPESYYKTMKKNGYELTKLAKVHLLVMCDASDNVDALSNNEYRCRTLEEKVWENYLGIANGELGNIFAYHWSKKATDASKMISEFDQLIKISSSSTNWKIIIVYIVLVIAFGTAGSSIANHLPF